MTHPGIDTIRQLLGDTRLADATLLERRDNLAALAGSVPPPDGVSVEVIELAERRAERLTPAGAPDGEIVLYLHGGGYVSGSCDTHRGLASAIALASGRTVITLDYRLAPEDPFPAGLNDALLAFDQLAPARVAIAGDSAGGGLTLATALALRDRAGALPVALGLISAWTDLTQTSTSMATKHDIDPMLAAASLSQMAAGYLAGADPGTPLASPLFGDMTGLPPVRIDVGSDEVLLDDSTVVADRLREAGVEVELQVWPNMIHVFQAFPPSMVPEAGEAVALLGTFLARHFAA